jgi:mRNA interferase RelE/StbE
MSVYQIRYQPKALKEFLSLDNGLKKRIAEAMEILTHNSHPSGCKKMSGYKNRWRIRVGDYRIVYEIHDGELIILVVRIAHRQEVYR